MILNLEMIKLSKICFDIDEFIEFLKNTYELHIWLEFNKLHGLSNKTGDSIYLSGVIIEDENFKY